MTELARRPELALAAALVLALLWLALGYWSKLSAVMGDEVGARLDALAGAATGDPFGAPAEYRYQRFSVRDYSGDRGPVPQPRPRYASIYDELVARLGLDPIGGAS